MRHPLVSCWVGACMASGAFAAEKVVDREIAPAVSHETVRRTLKKTR